MRNIPISLALVTLWMSAGACVAADLSSQARIGRPAAEKTALSRVPGGRIKQGELEKEDGRLVWSFDITQPNSKNIIEVQVDALNGKFVSQTTETPEDEAKEAAAQKKGKSTKKP